MVDTGSADVDSVAAVTSDFQDSAALKEELLGQEVEKEEAQTEALGNEDGKGTHTGEYTCRQIHTQLCVLFDNSATCNYTQTPTFIATGLGSVMFW